MHFRQAYWMAAALSAALAFAAPRLYAQEPADAVAGGRAAPRASTSEAATSIQAGLDGLMRQLADSMEKNTLTTVAVLDLLNLDHSVSNLGRYMSERSVITLHKAGKFTVIERDLRERTLKKLNLSAADLADPANIQLLAKALSIQALVKGSVTDLGDTVEFNLRLVRAIDNAGEVVAVARATVRKDRRVATLMGQFLAAPRPRSGTTRLAGTGGRGDEVKIDLGQDVVIEMMRIESGEFDMGSSVMEESRYPSDEYLHRVRITKPFYMAKHEVTQALWVLIMDNAPSVFTTNTNLPVDNVSYEDCQEFISRLNKRVPGGGFRLPTEAEWEYACRAGTATRYCHGDNGAQLGEYAWYDNYPHEKAETHPVGTKKPNEWGLHDMHGNLWEWCQDWYGEYELPAGGAIEDPVGPAGGECRVLRGGSYRSYEGRCRSARRTWYIPSTRQRHFGLRLARGVQ